MENQKWWFYTTLTQQAAIHRGCHLVTQITGEDDKFRGRVVFVETENKYVKVNCFVGVLFVLHLFCFRFGVYLTTKAMCLHLIL